MTKAEASLMKLVIGNMNATNRTRSIGLMKALNPQLSASQVCGTVEVSLFISIELLNIPSPGTLLPFHDARFNTLQFSSPSSSPHRPAESFRRPESGLVWDVPCGQRFAHCSHAPRQAWPNHCVLQEKGIGITDCSFVSGCSPPFLLKTQLPLTTGM